MDFYLLQAELRCQRDDLRDLLSIGEQDMKRAISELRERAVWEATVFVPRFRQQGAFAVRYRILVKPSTLF